MSASSFRPAFARALAWSRAGDERSIEPVVWSEPGARSASDWRAAARPLGTLDVTGPAQGISPAPGVLLPHPLARTLPPSLSSVRVDATDGMLSLDGLLVRPAESRLVLVGSGRTELVHSADDRPRPVQVGEAGSTVSVRVYDAQGALVRERTVREGGTIVLPAGGFAIAQS